MNDQTKLPIPFEPVLALITSITENGKSQWYEVVYYEGNTWNCFAGSSTFCDGEQVEKWKYCKDIME